MGLGGSKYWRWRLSQPIFGMKKPHHGGCYGCCQHFSDTIYHDAVLCTVCRKVMSRNRYHCCGTHTVPLSPRIRVPRVGSGRWKQFLEKFPHIKFKESLICNGGCSVSGETAESDS